MTESVTAHERRRALWSHIWALVILGGLLTGGIVWIVRKAGNRDVDAAENIVRKASETPSTLEFIHGQVVLVDGDWRLVAVEFDEQNTFGALIRRRGCVVFQWTSDNAYRWNPFPSPVLPCDVELQGPENLRFLLDGQRTLILRKDQQ